MNTERMLSILRGPHISEKSANMQEQRNQVAFKVAKDAAKSEIREAVEKLFNVQVRDVQVLNVKGKTKRTNQGRARRRSDWKKAYVTLEQGHEIDFAELG